MKKINEEEYSNLLLRGKGRSTRVHDILTTMKVGEIVLIAKSDWRQKKSPSNTARKIEKTRNMKFTVNALADNSGWAVKRVG